MGTKSHCYRQDFEAFRIPVQQISQFSDRYSPVILTMPFLLHPSYPGLVPPLVEFFFLWLKLPELKPRKPMQALLTHLFLHSYQPQVSRTYETLVFTISHPECRSISICSWSDLPLDMDVWFPQLVMHPVIKHSNFISAGRIYFYLRPILGEQSCRRVHTTQGTAHALNPAIWPWSKFTTHLTVLFTVMTGLMWFFCNTVYHTDSFFLFTWTL